MELFTDETIRGLLAQSLETATLDANGWHDHGNGPGSRQGDYIDWINWITIRNQAESVLSDVERIRSHPPVPKSIPVHAYLYQAETGRIVEVPCASAR
jgi:carbonic anhydrase